LKPETKRLEDLIRVKWLYILKYGRKMKNFLDVKKTLLIFNVENCFETGDKYYGFDCAFKQHMIV
jgi:hypothetical protein